MTPALLVVYALAVARVSSLFTHDEITRPLRERLVHMFDPSRTAHRLVAYALGADNNPGCIWCVSMWVGLGTSPIVWFWADNPIVFIIMMGLASSQVAGMTNGRS